MTAFLLIIGSGMFGAVVVTGWVIALNYIGWMYVADLPSFCKMLLMLCFSSSMISFIYLTMVLR